MADRFTDFSIEYDLDDINAQEDATITAVGNNQYVADISTILGLNTFPNIITQEKNHSILDGRCTEYNPNSDTVGYYSFYDSDANGEFSTNPKLTATFASYHSSYALTIGFTDCSPLEIKVTWYRGNTKLYSMVHEPEDRNPIVYIVQAVQSYNKIVIEILKTLPYHNVKIGYVQFGTNLIWSANDIKTGTITKGLSRLGDKLSIDKLDFELIDKDDKFNFGNPNGLFSLFKRNQAIYPRETVEGVDVPLGKFYMSSFTNTKGLAKISAVSYMGVLDTIPFDEGGVYVGVRAEVMLNKIFEVAGTSDYTIDSVTKNQLLYGTIKPVSCREAIQAVLFACRSILVYDNNNNIQIKKPSTAIISPITRATKCDTSLEQVDSVTGVTINFTDYSQPAGTERTEISSERYLAGTHTVKFQAPFTDIQISSGTLIKSSTYYVKFRVNSTTDVTISGKPYLANNRTVTVNRDTGDGNRVNVKNYTSQLCNYDTAIIVANSILEYFSSTLKITIKNFANDSSLDALHVVENPKQGLSNFVAAYEERTFNLTGSFVDNAKLIGYYDTVDLFYYTGTELYGNDDFII